MTCSIFLEKRNARAISIENVIASLILQVTLTSLREVVWMYESLDPGQGSEEIQQQYLKPKVKKLLELFTIHGGKIMWCVYLSSARRITFETSCF
jgi:hypothetical protein